MIALIKYLVHFLGKILFVPVFLARPGSRSKAKLFPKRILYITLAYRGDLILNFPALKVLKSRFPEAELTCWVREYNIDLAGMCASIDKVIAYDKFRFRRGEIFQELNPPRQHPEFFQSLKDAQYDICIDDSGLAFSSLTAARARIPLRIGRNMQGFGFLNHYEVPYDFDAHLIKKRFAMLKPLGIAIPDDKELIPKIKVAPDSRRSLLAKYNLLNIEPGYFTIQPLAGWQAKNWDNRKFAKVVTEFAEISGLRPVFIGGPDDKSAIDDLISIVGPDSLNLAGKLELAETAVLISGAAIHLGVDSVGSHLAAATNVKSLTIFGPTNPRLIAVLTDKNIAVQKKTSCTPADNKIYCCKDAGRSCDNVVCMQTLEDNMVLETLIELWRNETTGKIKVYS